MTIHVKQFPLSMSGLSGGAMFKTDITTGGSGYESRNRAWQDALWRYNAAYTVKTRADVATLNAFFLACGGREIAFNVQAGDDYAIPHSGSTFQSIGTGDGSDATWQIYKRYTDSGGYTYDRIITRPSATTADLAVKVNGTLKTHTTHYTYSTTTGIITFTGGNIPANGHDISITLAKFYVPMRFDTDFIDTDMLNWWVDGGADYSIHQIPDIPLVEVRD